MYPFFLSHGGKAMGEWCELLKNIKSNKDSFSKLLDNMNPLISKYVRLLYKNDREDIRQELILALWESILKMKYYNSDGECLKNKFLDLYRKSKKQNEIISIEIDETFEFPSLIESSYEFTELIFREDIKQILRNTNGKKQKISYQILLMEKSDAEIAKYFKVSRQYVHRLRKSLYLHLKNNYFGGNKNE